MLTNKQEEFQKILRNDLIRRGYGAQIATRVSKVCWDHYKWKGITSFEELKERLLEPEEFIKIRNFGSKCLFILQKEYSQNVEEAVPGTSFKDFMKMDSTIHKQMFKIEGEDEYYRPSDYPEAAMRAVQLGVKLEVVYFTYKLIEEDK